MPQNDIEVRTTEAYADHYIQEMIGAPPGWMVRSGISVIALFAIVMLVLAWLIRYPDRLTAPTVLTSRLPPIEVVAGVNGFLDSLWVSNGQIVMTHSTLATIADAALHADVVQLKSWLAQYNLEDVNVSKSKNPPSNLQLGSLANGYAALLQSLSDFHYFLVQPGMQQQIAAIQREIANTEQLNASLQRQSALLEAEIQIVQKDLERNRQLREGGVISATDLEEKEKALIQYQRQLENLPASMLQNKIRIEQLIAQQLQLRQQWTDDKTARLHALRQQIQALQGAITTWEQQFVR
ncbi:MAG TPA: hypothetical protein PKD70_15680 [Saprospiraceae bacterium]|nr:hypothetical protein [Saprospiraceae bacterium]